MHPLRFGRSPLSFLGLTFSLAVSANAAAMELDSLLPTDIPGYESLPAVSVFGRRHPDYDPRGIGAAGVTMQPVLSMTGGYDTNPNGAASGSGIWGIDPSLSVMDAELGVGGYVSGTYSNYPAAPEQNLSGYTIALGEYAALPRETIKTAAAIISSQDTGFGLNTIAVLRPIGVTAKLLRASDAWVSGMVTLTPEISVTSYSFDGYSEQNRTDYREALTGEFSSGGPAEFVSLLQATESKYGVSAYSAATYSALVGIADEATAIWKLRLLGGASLRVPRIGKSLSAPVLEASIEWMPGDLDSLRLDLARELDDPEQESAEGYTLSQLKLSVAHEYLRNLIIGGSFSAANAKFFHSPLIETLYSSEASVNWHLDRSVAVFAKYDLNNRQANFLPAANEDVFTLGVTWSP